MRESRERLRGLPAIAAAILLASYGDGTRPATGRDNAVRLRTAGHLVGGGISDAALWEIEPTAEADGCFVAFFEEGPEGSRCLGRDVQVEAGEGTRHYAGFVTLKDEPRGEEPPTVRLVTAREQAGGRVEAAPITTRSWGFFKTATHFMASGVSVRLAPGEAIEVFSTTYFPCEAAPEGCEDRVYSSDTDEQVDRTVYLALVRGEPLPPYEWADTLPNGVEVVPRRQVPPRHAVSPR